MFNNMRIASEYDPIILSSDDVYTPICTRGYTGALLLKMIIEENLPSECVRDSYGITADPVFFDVTGDSNGLKQTDVCQICLGDGFYDAFGFERNDKMQNYQTTLLKSLDKNEINPSDNVFSEYRRKIKQNVWNFETNKNRVFILISMDDKEIEAVLDNIGIDDILILIKSYNEAAYPVNGSKPFSKDAYLGFYKKLEKCFQFN